MENEVVRTKHSVYVGNQVGQSLENEFDIGYALKYENLPYYILKVWSFPNVTYFVNPNRDSCEKLTIFTKKIEDENGVRFQNPVGYGVCRTDLKEYLEVNLRFPKQKLYMSVYPDP